ncbi:MAG: acyltransferase [Desulfofustis sp.]|jgi:peptidoglycan/LPS O-acetylase OafA/YrhL
MTYRVRPLIAIIVALITFWAIKATISYTVLSSFRTIAIEAEFAHEDVLDIYFGSSERAGFREHYKIRSETFPGGEKSRKKIVLHNHVVRNLRLDTGTAPGTLKLYSITLGSNFGPGFSFDHRAIYQNFLPSDDIKTFSLEKDHVFLRMADADPYIIHQGELVQDNFFLQWMLPFIFALFSFLACKRFSVQNIDAFNDIASKRSSAGIKFGSLDGVRGLAALLVLAQHTGLTKTGGIFGVWLFFCLSGFLLTSPFIRQPSLALSRSYMTDYLLRRIKRIVPMYYVMITVSVLFLGKVADAIRHYLFLQADGHFWSISQEMFFYLILPLVMAVSYLLCRNRLLMHAIFLAGCALAAHRYLTTDLVALYGNGVHLKPFAGIFLTGVAAAFAYNYLIARFDSTLQRPMSTALFSLIGIVVLCTCLVMSAHPFEHLDHLNPWRRPHIFGSAAGLFILATMLARNSLLDKAMNLLPLKAVGIVGYSYYLLHPIIIECVRSTTRYFWDYNPTGIDIFLIAGIATYLVTIFTYSYIERPFIRK